METRGEVRNQGNLKLQEGEAGSPKALMQSLTIPLHSLGWLESYLEGFHPQKKKINEV